MRSNWLSGKRERWEPMTKKIVLVLVEGPSDEDALALVFRNLLEEQEMEFDVLHTDITAKEEMTSKYIVGEIEKEVDAYLGRNPFIEKEDILKVVQLIDTDGAFVASSQIFQSENGKTEYSETCIWAKNRDRLIRRNISKRQIVYQLSHMGRLPDSYPYEIYYFSRNLEHVLHNISEDLSDEEKEDLAYETAIRYRKNPDSFLSFLRESDFFVPGDYTQTWKFIMEDGNSLRRHCNLSVFFDRLLQRNSEEETTNGVQPEMVESMKTLKETQEAFRGEAERVGLKNDQDVLKMVKDIRRNSNS